MASSNDSSPHNPYFDAAQSLPHGDSGAAAAHEDASPSPSQPAANLDRDEEEVPPLALPATNNATVPQAPGLGVGGPPTSTSTSSAPEEQTTSRGRGPRVAIDENPTINIITPDNVYSVPIPPGRRRPSVSSLGRSTQQSSIGINRLRGPSMTGGADARGSGQSSLQPSSTRQSALPPGGMADPLPTVTERNSTCSRPEALEVDATDFASGAAGAENELPPPATSRNWAQRTSDMTLKRLGSRGFFPSSAQADADASGSSQPQQASGTPRTPRAPRTVVAPSLLYGADVLDLLDVVDPEVQTLNTLNNLQNSLFVPDLGRWINRRPVYNLSPVPDHRSRQAARLGPKGHPDLPEDGAPRRPAPPLRTRLTRLLPRKLGGRSGDDEGGGRGGDEEQGLPPSATAPGAERPAGRPVELPLQPKPRPLSDSQLSAEQLLVERASRRDRSTSIASQLSETHYAVLPHGVSLDGWSEEDKAALDDYVRHMLHSKRSKFHQMKRAFGKYVTKPLGFFVTLYATLITLFGLAWVLFLIGWIYVGERQLYAVNVIDNVLVALFAIVGDGLAPFRAVDTYHMIFIARYHNLTKRLRAKRALPKLRDENELPRKSVDVRDLEQARQAALAQAGRPSSDQNGLLRGDPAVLDDSKTDKGEGEDEEDGEEELSVLDEEQQRKLLHHQAKYAKQHSFYKPHQTETHHAFPHHLFVAITLLLDCHSLFQIALGTCTWAINYHTRPGALTATILCCSIACNITAGVLISIGDHRTRKKHIIEQMRRQGMTHHAMKKVIKRREDERREREEREEKEAAALARGAAGVGRLSGTFERIAGRSSGTFERITGAFGKSAESATTLAAASGAAGNRSSRESGSLLKNTGEATGVDGTRANSPMGTDGDADGGGGGRKTPS